MLGILLGKKLFGGNKKKKQIFYQNYGTFREQDDYYFITQTGKGKLILELTKSLKTRIPPSSSQAKTTQSE